MMLSRNEKTTCVPENMFEHRIREVTVDFTLRVV